MRGLELVNQANGQVFEAHPMRDKPKPRVAKPRSPLTQEGFYTMSQAADEAIAKDKTLDGVSFRVFHLIKSKLGFQNELLLSQAYIARELDLTRPQVSRAIKTLCDGSYLLIGDKKQGSCKSYRLNPQIAWKGEAKTHRKALQEMRADNVIPLFAEAERGE